MSKIRTAGRLGVALSTVALSVPALAGASSAATVASAGISPSRTSLDLGSIRVDGGLALESLDITNTGNSGVTIPTSGLAVSGPGAASYLVSGSGFSTVPPCLDSASGQPATVDPGASCGLSVLFLPTQFGVQQATLTVTASDGSTLAVSLTGVGTGGYYLVGARGETEGFGDAQPGAADPRAKVMSAPVVGVAATIDGNGYWTAGTDGTVYPSGDAKPEGDLAGMALNRPVVAIAGDPRPVTATTSSGTTSSGIPSAYWLASADGGVYAFGAPFLGSEGGANLNQPIVGMAATPDGAGYWLVASDGGIFSFGDASFFGSEGGAHLNKPIVGMAATPDGAGYWLVASDGGVFSFGDASFFGSEGGVRLNSPIVGMAATPDGAGYWLVAADGGVFSLGDAAFFGSLPGQVGTPWHSTDVKGLATTTQPLFTGLQSGATTNSSHTRVVTDLSRFRGRIHYVNQP